MDTTLDLLTSVAKSLIPCATYPDDALACAHPSTRIDNPRCRVQLATLPELFQPYTGKRVVLATEQEKNCRGPCGVVVGARQLQTVSMAFVWSAVK